VRQVGRGKDVVDVSFLQKVAAQSNRSCDYRFNLQRRHSLDCCCCENIDTNSVSFRCCPARKSRAKQVMLINRSLNLPLVCANIVLLTSTSLRFLAKAALARWEEHVAGIRKVSLIPVDCITLWSHVMIIEP